jgi:tetratricopeptide (TPR) repeat protein
MALDQDETKLAAAEFAYRRAISIDPSFAAAHTNLGNVVYRLGRADEAVRHYRIAIGLEPEAPEAFFNLAVLYHNRGNPSRAAAFLETAVTRSFQDRPVEFLAETYYRLALAYDECGNPELAGPFWRRVVELMPDSDWAKKAKKWFLITGESQ